MAEHYPELELNVVVPLAGTRSEVLRTLSPHDLEFVVKHTLRMTNITQPVTLSLLITDDETIRSLNKQYRQQDKPTDVLSFPLLDTPLVTAPAEQLWIPAESHATPHAAEVPPQVFVTPPELPTNLGDIVISWPTVLRQAAEAGHSPAHELLYLLSHGVLHLIGYDDHSEVGYQAMIHIQQAVLQVMGRKAQP